MQHMESCFAFLSCPQAVHNKKRKNKMRFISYDTIVKLMEDYLPESLKKRQEEGIASPVELLLYDVGDPAKARVSLVGLRGIF